MSLTLISHVPLAVQPAQQFLLLPNILTIDGIFITGFGSPKIWILPLSGSLPPADVEWRVLRQGKVPGHWDWGTPAFNPKDTGSSRRPLSKGNVRRGEGGHTEWATSEWDTQCWWKALEQNNVALLLQSRSGSGGGMQRWTWVRAFHCHLMLNTRSFSH